MDTPIERQAIRAAVAIAAVSAFGRSPEAISDLRDEAAQLIGLCIRPPASPDEVRAWCDDSVALIGRLVAADAVPEEETLTASAAILRLRLAAVRAASVAAEREKKPVQQQVRAENPKAPVELTENQNTVVQFIAGHPGIRSKDLTVALAASFSVRTIKRYLAELTALGCVRRTRLPDGGGVTYSVRE